MAYKRNSTPLEDDEQIALIEWLDFVGLKYTAIPNSTYTPHMVTKRRNHRLGVRAGFPDMVIVIPRNRSKDGEGYFLCMEMKRQKGGVVSKEQREWIQAINDLQQNNIQAYVAKGSEEAVGIIRHYLDVADYQKKTLPF